MPPTISRFRPGGWSKSGHRLRYSPAPFHRRPCEVEDHADQERSREREGASLRRPMALVKADRWLQTLNSQHAVAFVSSTVAVAIATAAGRLFLAMTPLPNISMVYLLAVLFSAVSFGMRSAVYASIL